MIWPCFPNKEETFKGSGPICPLRDKATQWPFKRFSSLSCLTLCSSILFFHKYYMTPASPYLIIPACLSLISIFKCHASSWVSKSLLPWDGTKCLMLESWVNYVNWKWSGHRKKTELHRKHCSKATFILISPNWMRENIGFLLHCLVS